MDSYKIQLNIVLQCYLIQAGSPFSMTSSFNFRKHSRCSVIIVQSQKDDKARVTVDSAMNNPAPSKENNAHC